MRTYYDVIVVGGGPAGATASIKCAEEGLETLLIEKGEHGRHKPCGGILPPIFEDIFSEALGRNIPREVKTSPETLQLHYVLPNRQMEIGVVRNYRLLNIDRDLFDSWLCEVAEESDVKVWFETKLLNFSRGDPLQVLVKRDEKLTRLTAKYLIGADGVYSRVRKALYGEARVKTLPVLQEHWRAKGKIEDHFYVFYRRKVASLYAYLIPKNGFFILGIEAGSRQSSIHTRFELFKKWLSKELAFKPISLKRRELWAIPYSFIAEGKGNVILVGDAAGLCNATSGEGIRFAVESGVAAGRAVKEALVSKEHLAEIYKREIEWIASFVRATHKYVRGWSDEERSRFIAEELNRSFPI